MSEIQEKVITQSEYGRVQNDYGKVITKYSEVKVQLRDQTEQYDNLVKYQRQEQYPNHGMGQTVITQSNPLQRRVSYTTYRVTQPYTGPYQGGHQYMSQSYGPVYTQSRPEVIYEKGPDMTGEVENLRSKLHNLEIENSDLRLRFGEVEAERDEQRLRINGYVAEIEELQTDLKAAEAEISRLQDIISSHEGTIYNLNQQQKGEIQQESGENQISNRESQYQAKLSTYQTQQTHSTIEELRVSTVIDQELNPMIKQPFQISTRKVLDMIDTTSPKYRSMAKDRYEKNEDGSQSESYTSLSKYKYQEIVVPINTIDPKPLLKKLSMRKSQCQSQKTEIARLNSEIESLNGLLEDLERRNSTLQEENQDLRNSQPAEVIVPDHSAEIENLEFQVRDLTKEIEILKAEVLRLESEKTHEQEICHDLTIQVKSLTQQLEENRTNNVDISEIERTHEIEIQGLRSEIQQLRIEIEGLKAELQRKIEECEMLIIHQEQLKSDKHQKINQLILENQQLQQNNNTLEKEKTTFSIKINEVDAYWQNEISKLKIQINQDQQISIQKNQQKNLQIIKNYKETLKKQLIQIKFLENKLNVYQMEYQKRLYFLNQKHFSELKQQQKDIYNEYNYKQKLEQEDFVRKSMQQGVLNETNQTLWDQSTRINILEIDKAQLIEQLKDQQAQQIQMYEEKIRKQELTNIFLEEQLALKQYPIITYVGENSQLPKVKVQLKE